MDLTGIDVAAYEPGVEVAAYERVSKDDSGIERSPEEQHDGHLVTCERYNWRLQTPTYREVGSASIYQRKARKAFDRLIADLKSGRFTARVLMLYSNNRGSRQTEEWIELINLCTERGVVFWVGQHERTYDPRKPRDRKQLIDDASKGELEAAEMSQNIRRTTASSALKGLPHGRLPFGYMRLYDERTKRFIEQVPDPVEAPIVREMYKRVVKGHTLKAIARDLNSRGLCRRGGGEWVPHNIALMLVRDLYIGVRVHDPGRKTAKHPPTSDAIITKGAWKPLVNKKTFLAATKILLDSGRLTNERPGAVVHFLSGIAVCDECAGVLRVNRRRGAWKYVCVKTGCVTLDEADLDLFAEDIIIEYLSAPELYAALQQSGDVEGAELEAVREQLAEQRSERRELQAGLDAGDLKVAFVRAAAPAIERRIADLERRERDLETPSVLAGLIEPGPGVRAQWAASELSTQRAIARILLAEDGLIGELRVKPVGAGRRREPIRAEHRVRFVREMGEKRL